MAAEVISDHVKRLHSSSHVLDAHCGLLIKAVQQRNHGTHGWLKNEGVARFREGGVDSIGLRIGGDTIFPLVFKTDRHLNATLQFTEAAIQEVEEAHEDAVLATTVKQMREAKAAGKQSYFLCMEGARPIEDHLEFLQVFYRIGVRRLQLTWNFRNMVAEGCGEKTSKGGISEFGVKLLAEVERLGMILDLSHIAESSFWSALDHYGGPIFVTHANARALCDHPRNLWDNQLEAIAKTGGVAGIVFVNHFIDKAGDASIDKLIDHVDHMVKVIGIDHIGMGCDWMEADAELQSSSMQAYPGLYPPNYQRGSFPEGLSRPEDVPNLTAALVRRGYSDEDVSKIMGGNFLRAFEQVIG